MSRILWKVETTISIKRYKVAQKHKHCVSWEDVVDYIWDGIRITASTLPKTTSLRASVLFEGRTYIKYDLGSSDLDTWVSAVSAIFQQLFPISTTISTRVRTSDARHGVLDFTGIILSDSLKEWATIVFAKERQQASVASGIKDIFFNDCILKFRLPYRLQVAEVLCR
jgi:hypothetical protein